MVGSACRNRKAHYGLSVSNNQGDIMRVGDIVTNTRAVWDNPHVPGGPFPAGCVGIVVDVRPDTMNNPPLVNYVDVMLSVEGEKVYCGNYTQGHFEVIV